MIQGRTRGGGRERDREKRMSLGDSYFVTFSFFIFSPFSHSSFPFESEADRGKSGRDCRCSVIPVSDLVPQSVGTDGQMFPHHH